MRQRFWHNFRRFWPIALLIFTEFLLATANYRPGTYLMGWDNVMPEFNFRQALTTNIYGAWQEHRGVGLSDGMGHAANLVHTLFLWLLSFTLPQNTIRYAFHFLMHFMGMVGMYFLLSNVIPAPEPGSTKENAGFRVKPGMTSLIGALFYGLNLITIQMFYTPLEAFSVHFAALPWLAYSLLQYLQKQSRNTLLLFFTISFLSTPQFFIPTLMLPIIILLGAITIANIYNWKQIRAALGTFFCINAFWLLPYIYALPYNAPIIQEAKINEMSSGEVYARNQAYGDAMSVLMLRGFMLDFEDLDIQGKPIFVMDAWRAWINQPATQSISVVLLLLILLGAFQTMKTKELRWVTGAWLMSFVFLANMTPGISDILEFIRNRVPLFAEAYRFPFTKFGLLFGFTGSILAIVGLSHLAHAISKLTRLSTQDKRATKSLGTFVLGISLLYFSLPAFYGKFFYDALRVDLPKDYIQLFNFMTKQDHTGRIAYLPQPSYWSWKHYRYGYVGSGFVWYGLPQPLMDRAFDPWSNVNENYYWELSYALYRKDPEALNAVFQKYDIRYIILDGYLRAPSHDRSLYIEETRELLEKLADTKIIGRSKEIVLYERIPQSSSFIRLADTMPTVAPQYRWTDNDIAYQSIGDYRTTTGAADITYPFRSLFTKRSNTEKEFGVQESETTIQLSSTLNTNQNTIIINKSADSVFHALTENALSPSLVKPCAVLKDGESTGERIDEVLRIITKNQRSCLSFGIPDLLHHQGYLVSVTSRHVTGRPLLFSIINNTAKHVEAEGYLTQPTKNNEKISINDWQTEYFILPPLTSDGLGYTIYVSSDGIGKNVTINDIKSINIYKLPYQNMVSLRAPSYTPPLSESPKPITQQLAATHQNSAQYTLNVPTHMDRQEITLVLSQSYHQGWNAYVLPRNSGQFAKSLPFLFGKKLTDHGMVNNWSNGWILPNTIQEGDIIQLYFLPQLLEWTGLSLSLLTFIIIVAYKKL